MHAAGARHFDGGAGTRRQGRQLQLDQDRRERRQPERERDDDAHACIAARDEAGEHRSDRKPQARRRTEPRVEELAAIAVGDVGDVRVRDRDAAVEQPVGDARQRDQDERQCDRELVDLEQARARRAQRAQEQQPRRHRAELTEQQHVLAAGAVRQHAQHRRTDELRAPEQRAEHADDVALPPSSKTSGAKNGITTLKPRLDRKATA
ncbi:MAG TPA: hypothetical protein VGG74_03775 [Kofleriaceae bacterium]